MHTHTLSLTQIRHATPPHTHRYLELEAWHSAGVAAYTLAHLHHALHNTAERDAAATQFAMLRARCRSL